MKKYDKIVKLDNEYKPISEVAVLPELPPGIYEVDCTQTGDIFFSKIKTTHDELVDLPNTEYDQVIREIQNFMTPETREKFKSRGYIYKRSTLLYGPPGTGKTCIVNRLVQSVIADGGIALFSPNPKLLEESFKILDCIQPHTRVMVIFEELDQLIGRYESELLNILDGEIQKSNVIYVATTNYIDKIPPRIRRPGRFSSVIAVDFPSAETRKFYLKHKLNQEEDKHIDINNWVDKTAGFSIDELKETVLSVLCLGYPLDTIVARIQENKGIYVEVPQVEDDDDDYFDPFARTRKKDR